MFIDFVAVFDSVSHKLLISPPFPVQRGVIRFQYKMYGRMLPSGRVPSKILGMDFSEN